MQMVMILKRITMSKNKRVEAILVNDVHLTKDNGSLVKNIFRQLIELCKQTGAENIFCGGDVFTNRSGQPLSCLTDWKEILNMLAKAGVHFHTIPGNHDKTDGDDEKSYLDVYDNPYFHLYRKGTAVDFNGLLVAFIPFFGDEKWLEEYEAVKSRCADALNDEESCAILITHSGFDGVANNDGSKVESIIKPSMFKAWDKVLIGHYHNASKLADNVFYTGSAYQNNYGETIEDKGCTLIMSDGSIKHQPLQFPKYIKEVIDVNDSETLRNIIEKYEGENYDHIRLVFVGKKVDAKKVNLADLSAKGFDAKFESIEETEAIEVAESEVVMCYDKKAILKDFTKFCAESGIKGDKLKYGMNLIKGL